MRVLEEEKGERGGRLGGKGSGQRRKEEEERRKKEEGGRRKQEGKGREKAGREGGRVRGGEGEGSAACSYVSSKGGLPSASLGVRGWPLASLQKGNRSEEKARAWSISCLAMSNSK